ncbi:MAG: DUF4199 domain-containing protein [Crocinitomicaceae bacterium]|jgi:hypothetical protein
MNKAVKYGLFASLVWIAVKMGALALGISLYDIKYFGLLNMFLLTFIITWSIYKHKQAQTESNLLIDIKNGMTAGVPYTVIVSVFLYFYYGQIFPEFRDKKMNEVYERIDTPKELDAIRKNQPELENKSDLEIKQLAIKDWSNKLDPQFTMMISLLALLFYTTINSLLISLVFRRIIFRN